MSCRLKQLIQRGFLEYREAQDLQDCVETFLDVQALANDRDGRVNRHGDPDLALHRVFRGAEERLYSQVLLDPFKKQFHLPPGTVDVCDCHGRQGEVVGQEDQGLVARRVAVPDPPQPVREIGRAVDAVRPHDLVADEAGGAIHGSGGEAAELGVRLRSQDEEAAAEMKTMEALEVEVGPVHDVERPGFRNQHVQDVDVMQLSVGYVNECGNVAMQVEERVQLDGALRFAEPRPREQRQAEVDRRGVKRVDGVLDIKAGKRVVGVDAPGDVDEVLREVGVDPPVTGLVGVGEVVAGHPATDAHVVELSGLGAQAGFDVAQAAPVGELGEGHAPVLIRTCECLDIAVPAISRDTAAERVPWQVLHDLGENQAAGIHRVLPLDGAQQGGRVT